ncbi:MAG: hypothetical protein SF052_18855 [Bacteroidia bacterium]|nr:hypothetical protein [Bacteroidia bacterium]
MIHIYKRELTPAERTKLNKYIPGFWKWMESVVLKWIFIFMLSFIPLLLSDELFHLNLITNGPILMFWISLTTIVTLLLVWREGKQWKNSFIGKDLQSGLVEVTECTPAHAIEIEEDEEMGIGYFLDVGNNQTLFLIGKYLYKQDIPYFPSTQIEIIRAPQSGIVLDIKVKGEYLPPMENIAPFSTEDYASGRVPMDGEVINKPLKEMV